MVPSLPLLLRLLREDLTNSWADCLVAALQSSHPVLHQPLRKDRKEEHFTRSLSSS